MKRIKIVQFLFLIVFTSSAFTQESSEQKIERAKNTPDKVSKFIGDTMIVKQSILAIENAINSYDVNEILYLLNNNKEKKSEKDRFINDKKNLLSQAFVAIDSVYGIRHNSRGKDDIFAISNLKFTIQDTIVIADLDIQFADFSTDEFGNPIIVFSKTNSEAMKGKSNQIVHDTWIFERIYGQWKLISCENLFSTIEKFKSIK